MLHLRRVVISKTHQLLASKTKLKLEALFNMNFFKSKCKLPGKGGSTQKTVKIYRYDGKKGSKPYVKTYEVDTSKCGAMMLDILLKVKEMDPTLSLRFSCREGICGSCAMNIQGSNNLACIMAIPKQRTISIYPLPHLYVIRDLIVDLSHFYKQYKDIKPYLIRSQSVSMGSTQYAQSVADSKKMVGLYECVLCACCTTGCPTYWWHSDKFLGPATLQAAYRWIIDSRDDAYCERVTYLRTKKRMFACHMILNCTAVCPKHLNPGKVMSQLKLMLSEMVPKPPPDLDPMLFSNERLPTPKGPSEKKPKKKAAEENKTESEERKGEPCEPPPCCPC